jgi:gamma-butyrobetaine dioxygenase
VSLARYDLAELIEPDRHFAWLDDLATLGVTVTEGVPRDRSGLTAVADLIGIMESNNYGIDWDIVSTADPFNQVDSDLPLRVHSDLPYRRLPPGFQVLLAAEASAEGGETLLVDGYRLSARIQEDDPDAWATLTTVDRAFSYIRPEQRYIGGGPIVGLDAEGAPDVIRHAPDLVLPVRDGDGAAADRALEIFVSTAASAELEFRIRLEPGQALTVNNHRVLHGRGPVDLGTGERRLLGCYIGSDEFASARRVLERDLGS